MLKAAAVVQAPGPMASVLGARPQRPAAPHRCRHAVRKVLATANKTDSYVSPSTRTASTELQRLEELSTVGGARQTATTTIRSDARRPETARTPPPPQPAARPTPLGLAQRPALPQVVPDVLLSQSLQKVEEPKAATSSRSVLAGIMSQPTSMRRFKVRRRRRRWAAACRAPGGLPLAAPSPSLLRAERWLPPAAAAARPQFAIEQARFYDKCDIQSDADRTSCQVGGTACLKSVPGPVAVSTAAAAAGSRRRPGAQLARPRRRRRRLVSTLPLLPHGCHALPLLPPPPPQVDKALVNVGSMFLETVTGRVSTEVDPRIAHDTGAARSRSQARRPAADRAALDAASHPGAIPAAPSPPAPAPPHPLPPQTSWLRGGAAWCRCTRRWGWTGTVCCCACPPPGPPSRPPSSWRRRAWPATWCWCTGGGGVRRGGAGRGGQVARVQDGGDRGMRSESGRASGRPGPASHRAACRPLLHQQAGRAAPHRTPQPTPPRPSRSFVQGAAAAQAGVSVIQPNVGRLHDWYNRHPGVIRDPNVRLGPWGGSRGRGPAAPFCKAARPAR